MAIAPALSESQRRRLAGLADGLITGGAGLPSASGADVHAVWIDRTLAARPDLVPTVLDVLDRPGSVAEVLAALWDSDRPKFDAFALAVSGSYLINPQIRQALGFPGPVPAKTPAFPDEAESYLEDGILDVVIQRGPIYRPTP